MGSPDNTPPTGNSNWEPHSPRTFSRRKFLAAASMTAGLLAFGHVSSMAQQVPPSPTVDTENPSVTIDGTTYTPPEDPTKQQGLPFTERGFRSPFVVIGKELGARPDNPTTLVAGWALAPLQDFFGILTPSDLHFVVSHAGTALVNPDQHTLLIHGMVERPTTYTLDEILRFPSFTRTMVLECSGNGYLGYGGSSPDDDAGTLHGLASTSEWIGVKMSTILQEIGVHPGATWALAEGGGAAVMTRSIPVEKLWDDAFIAYGQNGEAVRPEQGYPFRLMLPGWEGNMNVKWLRRLVFSDQPFQTRDETRIYTDPLPDARARQFTFVVEANSVITFPSGGQTIPGAGYWQISGLAWSGRGAIERVEVSVDNGETWFTADLEEPVLPISFTRFNFDWVWDGRATVIMSRAIDETGYIQPTQEELLEVRGTQYLYHFNGIQPWVVADDGSVTNGWK